MIRSILPLMLFTSGGDGDNDEPPRVTPPKPSGMPKKATPPAHDDDDDDDDEFIDDPKDRKLKKLSRENSRRRNRERELQDELNRANEQIQELTEQVNNGVKVQNRYDKLKGEMDKLQGSFKEQAIRTAISGDKTEDGKPRAWYDTDMVLKLLDRDSLAIDISDGSVGGLEEQLNQIAAEKPFLVKNAGGGQGNSAPSNQLPTGNPPQTSAGGTRTQVTAANEQEMINMFPALRGRV